MPNLTITHGDVTISVRESIGSDIFDEDLVKAILGDSIQNHPFYRVNQFVDALVRSEVTGDLGFAWPTSVIDKAIIPAYDAWRHLPKELLKKWASALHDVNEAPGDKDVQPIQPGEALPPPQN